MWMGNRCTRTLTILGLAQMAAPAALAQPSDATALQVEIRTVAEKTVQALPRQPLYWPVESFPPLHGVERLGGGASARLRRGWRRRRQMRCARSPLRAEPPHLTSPR